MYKIKLVLKNTIQFEIEPQILSYAANCFYIDIRYSPEIENYQKIQISAKEKLCNEEFINLYTILEQAQIREPDPFRMGRIVLRKYTKDEDATLDCDEVKNMKLSHPNIPEEQYKVIKYLDNTKEIVCYSLENNTYMLWGEGDDSICYSIQDGEIYCYFRFSESGNYKVDKVAFYEVIKKVKEILEALAEDPKAALEKYLEK